MSEESVELDAREMTSSQESTKLELAETASWPGPYSFCVMTDDNFVKQGCVSKYSSSLDKIFCITQKAIKFTMSIDLSTSGVIVKNLYIKAQLVYKDDSLSERPVERCASCTETERKSTPGTTEDVLKHVLRCTHKKSEYQQDVETRRLSVIAPMGMPQPGATSVSRNYELKCLSSCKTINRNDLSLVFTLLENRAQVGRRAFAIKICTCPLRLWRNDQYKLQGISQKGGAKQKRRSAASKSDTTEPDQMKLSELEIAAKDLCVSPNSGNSRTFHVKEQANDKMDDVEESSCNSQESRDLWLKAHLKFKTVADTLKSPNPSLRQLGKVCLRQLRNFVDTAEDLIEIEGVDSEVL